MSQYSAGTVSTVIDTNVVTGVNTSWLAFVSPGDEIKIGTDKFFYIVGAVASNTSITLTVNYPSSKTTQSYIINADFTHNNNIPLVNQGDVGFADTYSRAMRIIDSLIGLGMVYLGSIIDNDLNAAPGAPADGDSYVVAAGVVSGDDWYGYEGYHAEWDDSESAWVFTLPGDGNFVFVVDEGKLFWYTGSAWVEWIVTIGGHDETIQFAQLDSASTIAVTHNLQKKLVHVSVMDTNGELVEPSVTYTNTTTCTLDFTGLPTGDAPWYAYFSQ